jgi:hypothetical protein
MIGFFCSLRYPYLEEDAHFKARFRIQKVSAAKSDQIQKMENTPEEKENIPKDDTNPLKDSKKPNHKSQNLSKPKLQLKNINDRKMRNEIL